MRKYEPTRVVAPGAPVQDSASSNFSEAAPNLDTLDINAKRTVQQDIAPISHSAFAVAAAAMPGAAENFLVIVMI